MQKSFLKGNFVTAQHASLYFLNSATEGQFQRDVKQCKRFSLPLCVLSLSLISVLLSIFEQISYLYLIPFFLLFFFRTESILHVLAIVALMAIPHYLLLSTESFAESLGLRMVACLIHYLTIRRWTKYFLCLFLELFVTSPFKSWSFGSLFSALFCLVVYSILEREFRDQWLISNLYKKAYKMHSEMYASSSESIFIIDSEFTIIHLNRKASSFFNLRETGSKVTACFPQSCQSALEEQISESLAGRVSEKEYMLEPADYILRLGKFGVLGMKIWAEPVTWIDGQYVKVSCRDCTDSILARAMPLRSLKSMNFYLNSFRQSLIRQTRKMDCSDLVLDYLKIEKQIASLSFLHSKLFGNAELRKEPFDANVQCQNVMDICFRRASINGLSLVLTKDQTGCRNLYSDKNAHNLMIYSLLNMAISNSVPRGEISLTLQSSNFVTRSVTITYKLVFYTGILSEADLRFLVGTQSKSMRELSVLLAKHSLEVTLIDSCLDLFGGNASEVSIDTVSNKAIVTLKIPFETVDTEPSDCRISLNKSVAIENSHIYRLRSIDSSGFMASSPTHPPSIDEESKLVISRCESLAAFPPAMFRFKPENVKIKSLHDDSDSEPEDPESLSNSILISVIPPNSPPRTYAEHYSKLLEKIVLRIHRQSQASSPVKVREEKAMEKESQDSNKNRYLVIDRCRNNSEDLSKAIRSTDGAECDIVDDGDKALDMFISCDKAGVKYKAIFINSEICEQDIIEKIRQLETEMQHPCTFICAFYRDQEVEWVHAEENPDRNSNFSSLKQPVSTKAIMDIIADRS